MMIAFGNIAGPNMQYWGFDINGGIAYVFYYDPATLNVYYRTTTDGINWSAETPWEITYPTPYANSVLDWTQMALTDAGNPILVFDILDNDDMTYPFSHKTYIQVASDAAPIQVSDDAYACSWYPTIATGRDHVVVLMHVWTNGLEDSLARHDLFYNWSDDNGTTWHTPMNITASVRERPCLAQLSKRLDATNRNFYYFYGVHLVVDLDILWMIYFLSGHRLEPAAWYVGWHPITMPGVEENKQRPNLLMPRLQIYPNPFRQITDIRYEITREVDSRQKIVVNMKIYDAAGKLVKQFDYRTIRLSNQIIWDGTDDFGRPVPAGVYFVQLKNGKISVGKNIIKLE